MGDPGRSWPFEQSAAGRDLVRRRQVGTGIRSFGLVAIVMLATGDERGWALAGATAAVTLLGYVLTRTTGLPGSTDDVGNWGELLAVWAMVAEIGVVAMASAVLLPPRNA